MNTKATLGAATAALVIGVGFSEPASALTFRVDAQHLDLKTGAPTEFGLTGTFDFTGGVFSNINLRSSLTGQTYTSLFGGQPSTDKTAYFEDPSATVFSELKLTFASALSSAKLGDTISLEGGTSLKSLEVIDSPFLAFPLAAPLTGSATAVPTPALLPGLIGMGVAALRRKQEEETSEDNA